MARNWTVDLAPPAWNEYPGDGSGGTIQLSDTTYNAVEFEEREAVLNSFGASDDKSPVTHGTISIYDTSVIPLGAVVQKAKIEMKAFDSKSNAMTADFNVLAIDDRFNKATRSHFDAQFIYKPIPAYDDDGVGHAVVSNSHSISIVGSYTGEFAISIYPPGSSGLETGDTIFVVGTGLEALDDKFFTVTLITGTLHALDGTTSTYALPELMYPNLAPSSATVYETTDSLWEDSRVEGHIGDYPRLWMGLVDGTRSLAQAWTRHSLIDDDTPMHSHKWLLRRVDETLPEDTQIVCRIYNALGSAGAYTKGRLIDEGSPIDADTLATSFTMTSMPLKDGPGSFTPEAGRVYISEVASLGFADTTHFVDVGWSKTFDGSEENATFYAESGMTLAPLGGTSSSHPPRWSGSENDGYVHETDEAGSGNTIWVPAMTASSNYIFGHSDYSDETNFTEIDEFADDLNTALGSRTSLDDRVAIRIEDLVGATQNNQRQIMSASNATATRGSLHGLILTVDYILAHRTISAVGTGTSAAALTGAGVSATAMTGSGTSSAALSGDGVSVHETLTGTGTSSTAIPSGI